LGSDDDDVRLLVAEDEQPIRNLLVRGLTEVGYVVDDAQNGGDALHLLRMYSYAAAIIDWRMPEIRGSMWSGQRGRTRSRFPC
jgi:DNA-binding response OmpR family regulator